MPHRRVLMFLGLTFLWSWSLWTPAVAFLPTLPVPTGSSSGLTEIPGWFIALTLVGAYGPSIAALIVTRYTEGRAGVRALLGRLRIWRVGLRWHVVAWTAPSVFVAAAIILFVVKGGSLPSPGVSRLYLILPAVLLAIPFGPLGEELGWRGFLLPELQKVLTPASASLLIGVIWTLWHLPLYWAPVGTLISGAPVTIAAVMTYLLFVTGLAFIFTWLFNHSNGSVLLTIILHASSNTVIPLFLFPPLPESVTRQLLELSIIPLWLAVGAILIADGKYLGRERTAGSACAT